MSRFSRAGKYEDSPGKRWHVGVGGSAFPLGSIAASAISKVQKFGESRFRMATSGAAAMIGLRAESFAEIGEQ